jgi:hypothetical protein
MQRPYQNRNDKKTASGREIKSISQFFDRQHRIRNKSILYRNIRILKDISVLIHLAFASSIFDRPPASEAHLETPNTIPVF